MRMRWKRIAIVWALLIVALICITKLCFAADNVGIATFYTTKSCQREGTSGVYTASGERYDENALTCALRQKGYGRDYEVCNLDTNQCVVVKHNDYGPGHGPARRGVVVDLTPKAFRAIGGSIQTLPSGREVGELKHVAVMEVQ